ncbi:unnamed protein product [Calypogeia fissa]
MAELVEKFAVWGAVWGARGRIIDDLCYAACWMIGSIGSIGSDSGTMCAEGQYGWLGNESAAGRLRTVLVVGVARCILC